MVCVCWLCSNSNYNTSHLFFPPKISPQKSSFLMSDNPHDYAGLKHVRTKKSPREIRLMYQDKEGTLSRGSRFRFFGGQIRREFRSPASACSGPAVRAPPRPSRPAAPSEGTRPSGGAACGPQSCRRKLLPAIYAKGTGLAQSGPGLEPGPDCSPLRGR